MEDAAELAGCGLGAEPLRWQVPVLGEVRLPAGVEQLRRIEIFVGRTVIDQWVTVDTIRHQLCLRVYDLCHEGGGGDVDIEAGHR